MKLRVSSYVKIAEARRSPRAPGTVSAACTFNFSEAAIDVPRSTATPDQFTLWAWILPTVPRTDHASWGQIDEPNQPRVARAAISVGSCQTKHPRCRAYPYSGVFEARFRGVLWVSERQLPSINNARNFTGCLQPPAGGVSSFARGNKTAAARNSPAGVCRPRDITGDGISRHQGR